MGNGPGLVEEDEARPGESFECIAALDQHAPPRRPAHRHGDRQRRGQPECAGARHDQQGDGMSHRLRRIEPEPETQRQHGQHEHGGHEIARKAIGCANDRCAARGCFLNHLHQAADASRFTGGLDAHANDRDEIHRTRCHAHAFAHIDRLRFASEQALIDLR